MSSGRSRQQSRGGRGGGGGGGGGRDYRRYGGNDNYPRSRGGYRLDNILPSISISRSCNHLFQTL